MKNSKNTEVKANESVAAQTTTTAVEKTTKNTPPAERRYQLIAAPAIAPRGKQRQIVIAALAQDPNREFTIDEITKFATTAGLTANAGVKLSCMWHLHHLSKLGVAKVVNPTIEVEAPAKQPESTVAA